MTEQEAIKHAREYIKYLNHSGWEKDFDAIDTLIVATEEIQQYRAIGTVEEITKIINFLSFDDDTSVLEDLRMLIKYYEIGTVEELKEEKEKQIAKKPLPIITDDNEFICVICPTCQRTAVEVDDLYCRKCGQKLVFNWGNEDAE